MAINLYLGEHVFLFFDRKNVKVDLLQLFAIKNDNQKLFDALQNATK